MIRVEWTELVNQSLNDNIEQFGNPLLLDNVAPPDLYDIRLVLQYWRVSIGNMVEYLLLSTPIEMLLRVTISVTQPL